MEPKLPTRKPRAPRKAPTRRPTQLDWVQPPAPVSLQDLLDEVDADLADAIEQRHRDLL